MAKPYTLRQTKGGPKIMTLSADMERRFLAAPPDAVRLTIEKAFEQIRQFTGNSVVLNPEQYERLSGYLGNQPTACTETLSRRLMWRWFVQGIRYADTKDMAHFLDVATEMVTLLSSPALPEPTSTT